MAAFMFRLCVPYTQVPGANKTNFPVLFNESISAIPAGFWPNISDSCALDVRFYSDPLKTVEYKRTIEEYTPSTSIRAWVQVPTLYGSDSSTNNNIFCEVGSGTTASDNSIWTDLEAQNIQHFEDDVLDDSTNANNGTLVNSPTYTTGKLGRALEFDKDSTQYVVLDNNIMFNDDIVAEAWVYLNSYPVHVPNPNFEYATIASRGTYCVNWYRGRSQFIFAIDSTGHPFFQLNYSTGCTAGSRTNSYTSDAIVPLSTWTHVAVVSQDNTSFSRQVDFYVNGEKRTDASNVLIALTFDTVTNHQTQIGATFEEWGGGGPSQRWPFDGRIDELRIYRQNPLLFDDGWMQATYNSQNDPDTFFTCGTTPFYVFSDRIAQDGFNPPADSTWLATFGEWNIGEEPPYIITDPRYWVALSDSTWNDTANWSYFSGGPGGAPVPISNNTVVFDNGGIGRCDIDTSVDVNGFYCSGYGNTISQNGFPISVDSCGALFWSGVFEGSGDDIRIAGNLYIGGAANFTSTDQTLSCDSTFTYYPTAFFEHNSGIISLDNSGCMIEAPSMRASTLQFNADQARVSQSMDVNDLLVLNSGSARHLGVGASINLKGDASCRSGYNQWNNFNNLTIYLDGTEQQQIKNEIGCIVPTLYVNKNVTEQVVCDGGSPLRVKGDFWVLDGTFNMNGLNVQVGL